MTRERWAPLLAAGAERLQQPVVARRYDPDREVGQVRRRGAWCDALDADDGEITTKKTGVSKETTDDD